MKRFLTLLYIICSFVIKLCSQDSIYSAVPRHEVLNAMPVFYEQMKAKLSWPLAYENSGIENFDEWRQKARATIYDLMQNIPDAPADYDMMVEAEEQRDGYKAQKIFFNLSEWSRVPAYLLIPNGEGPFPAILMLHDHGAHFSIGKEKMLKPFDVSDEVMQDAQNWTVACYDSVFVGDYFAQNGYVVLALDALFWGERGRKEGVDYDAQQALACNFLQMGSSWGAFINMDDVRSAEFLSSLPMVDAKKIATLGHSMGAYRSWMASALSDVIAASVNICWFATTDGLMTMTNNQNRGGSAYSMLIPGLRRYMDYAHVAAIACPKPTLFFNGKYDKLFPVDSVEDGYTILRHIWHSQNADDRLETRLWDEKHYYNREMQRETLNFLNKWLKN